MKKIGKNQLRAIWAQTHQMGLNEKSLRQFVESETGKKSLRSLTPVEAQKILFHLRQKRLNKIRKEEKGSEGLNYISEFQISFIHGLTREVDWDRSRIQRLTQRMYGLKELEKMNKKQASGLIEALKAIKNRRAA